jgi:hypothetical protein
MDGRGGEMSTAKNEIEELIRAYEQKVENDRRLASVSATFWGSLVLDPDKVYVDKVTADRSMRELEKLLSSSDAR